jgi:hypothetical protein
VAGPFAITVTRPFQSSCFRTFDFSELNFQAPTDRSPTTAIETATTEKNAILESFMVNGKTLFCRDSARPIIPAC